MRFSRIRALTGTQAGSKRYGVFRFFGIRTKLAAEARKRLKIKVAPQKTGFRTESLVVSIVKVDKAAKTPLSNERRI